MVELLNTTILILKGDGKSRRTVPAPAENHNIIGYILTGLFLTIFPFSTCFFWLPPTPYEISTAFIIKFTL